LKLLLIQRDIDLHIIDFNQAHQRYNPKATFFASAGAHRAWMKTNNRFTGESASSRKHTDYYQAGKCATDCIDVFARTTSSSSRRTPRRASLSIALTLLNDPGMTSSTRRWTSVRAAAEADPGDQA